MEKNSLLVCPSPTNLLGAGKGKTEKTKRVDKKGEEQRKNDKNMKKERKKKIEWKKNGRQTKRIKKKKDKV